MADYIDGYTAYLVEERHSSDNTVSSYVRDVTQFAAYLRDVEEEELPVTSMATISSPLRVRSTASLGLRA